MKLETKKTELYQNVESQTFEIGSDIESKAIQFQLIMDKLYTNPLRATIREIIANAIDANREAGNKNVISLCMPGLEPTLWITDFGSGISPQRMEEVYTKVFTSTKRDNNREIGCYGIGRLSCLSLAQQYPLVTRVDGTEYHYAIYLNDKGIPDSSLLHTEETDKANGTSVGIPASYSRNLLKYIVESLVFTDALVDCPEVERYLEEERSKVFVKGKDWVLRDCDPHECRSEAILVVGGVPYSLPKWIKRALEEKFDNQFERGRTAREFFEWGHDTYYFPYIDRKDQDILRASLVIDIPIGTLSLSTSREEIQDTEDNLNIIYEKFLEVCPQAGNAYEKALYNMSLEKVAKLSDYRLLRRYLGSHTSLVFDEVQVKERLDGGDLLLYNKAVMPLTFGFDNKRSTSNILYSPKPGERIGKVRYEGHEIRQANSMATFYVSILDFLEGNIVIQECSKFGKQRYYSEVPMFKEKNSFIFIVNDLNTWRTDHPVLATLEYIGANTVELKAKYKNKSKKSSSSSKPKPVHKYIRPANQNLPPGSYWSDLFHKDHVDELPKEGLYVDISYPRDNVKRVLEYMTKEERERVYFVTDSQIPNLPDSFQDLGTYLRYKKTSRHEVERYLLEISLLDKNKRECLHTLYEYFLDCLSPSAKDFLKDLEESIRLYKQEKYIDSLYLLEDGIDRRKSQQPANWVQRYLFDPDKLTFSQQKVLSFLFLRGNASLVKDFRHSLPL